MIKSVLSFTDEDFKSIQAQIKASAIKETTNQKKKQEKNLNCLKLNELNWKNCLLC